MELHSYAKRRVAKKWSTEQKRKLVEARISHDGYFSQKPTASVAPWKKIVSLAKLDDYNVFFVRKQWSNMVAKYKQYKQNRLGNIPTKAIDAEMIRKITHEWEFFEPIHRFMTHKTTNLHSYALPTTQLSKAVIKPDGSQAPAPQLQNANSNSSTERANLFSSDTNEDFGSAHLPDDAKTQNTDHDFYTKKSAQQQLSYFADVSDDTQESVLPLEVPTTKGATLNGQDTESLHKPLATGDQVVELKIEQQSDAGEQQEAAPATVNYTELNGGTNGTTKVQGAAQRKNQPHSLSERDKYYRHKRRFNRRLERRFDSILNVFGQIVKAEYPNIDVSPLLGATAAAGAAVVNRLFKSENEDSAEEEQSSSDAEIQMSSAEERETGEGLKQSRQGNSDAKNV